MSGSRAYPNLIAGLASEEYAPVPPGRPELRARAAIDEKLTRSDFAGPSRVRNYLAGRMATATVLRRMDIEAGGGFFAVPVDAERDEASAATAFDRGPDGH